MRSFDEFVKVHPEIFLVSRDRLSVAKLALCQPDKKQELLNSIQHELNNHAIPIPRIPEGKNVLSDFSEASGASSLGAERPFVLYMACQWAIRANKEEMVKKAKELGYRFNLTRATLSQSLELLGIEPSGDPAYESIMAGLKDKYGIDDKKLHEFGEVAEYYLKSAVINGYSNWGIIQNWMAGRMAIEADGNTQKADDKSHPPIKEAITRGIQINAVRLTEELMEQARALQGVDEAAAARQASDLVKRWHQERPYGFFPGTVEAIGTDVHIALGNSLTHDAFLKSVFDKRNYSETLKGEKIDARGVHMPYFQKILVSTGQIEKGPEGVHFDTERFIRTHMEEMFHAAEGATILNIDGVQANPRHLINRNRIHVWTEALEGNSEKLVSAIKKAKLSTDKLRLLEKNIDTHLMLEGTQSADELAKMSLKEKTIALCDGVINLHSGYEGTWFVGRNAETLVRMHRVMQLVFQDREAGLDATSLLATMMPELHGLYTKVVLPQMIVNEMEITGTSLTDKVKTSLRKTADRVNLMFQGGIARAAGGITSEDIMMAKEEERLEYQEFITHHEKKAPKGKAHDEPGEKSVDAATLKLAEQTVADAVAEKAAKPGKKPAAQLEKLAEVAETPALENSAITAA